MPKKKFEIPENLIGHINEMSSGGFVLFTLDADGNPVVTTCFDGVTESAAMQYHISNWIKALDAINFGITTNLILGQHKSRKKN